MNKLENATKTNFFVGGGGSKCVTVGGRPCVFPFIYNGRTWRQCTPDDWCATEVHQAFNIVKRSPHGFYNIIRLIDWAILLASGATAVPTVKES